MRNFRGFGDVGRRLAASFVLLMAMLLLLDGKACQGFFLPLLSYASEEEKGIAGRLCESLSGLALGLQMSYYGGGSGEDSPETETLWAQGTGTGEQAAEAGAEWADGKMGTQATNNGGGTLQTETETGEEILSAGEGSVVSASGELPEEAKVWEALTMEELLRQENGLYGGFARTQKSATYDWSAMADYETLLSTFYAIDSSALAGSDLLNLQELKGYDLTVSKTDAAPQILIYHTHSKETFADSVQGDPEQSIVGVGSFLTKLLEEEYGYSVLHHTAEYDPVRDEAYAKSLTAIEQLLQENPSIQVVIDLHRDSGNPAREMTVDIDGRKTARFMFFNGISRSRRTGDIAYLANPNLKENLAFSFQMQAAAGEYYPGLTRKIYIKQYRYNMHLRGKTLLIELGDENNTLEEAKNACYPIAHLLDLVLSGQN